MTQLTLYDNSLVTKNDIYSNFFAQKEDINTNSRADITQRGLMEINNFAILTIFKGELSNDFSILKEYEHNLVIITEIISLETAEALNQYCRINHIGFIYTSEFGLSSFLFTDFGDDFIIEDNNGLEPNKYYIKSISNSCPGIVEIDPIKNNLGKNNYLNIATGDFVSFKDVKGMLELNDTPPRPIRLIDKTKFTIEDTTKFQEFTGVGIVEEVKVPRPTIFKPLSEAINVIYYEDVIEDYLNEDSYFGSTASKMGNDLLIDDNLGIINNEKKSQDNIIINEEKKENIPWIKMFYSEFENDTLKNLSNEKMHLVFLVLHEYFNLHQDLPNFNKIQEIKECINISLKILSKAKEEGYRWAINLCKIDKPFLDNVFKFCKFKFTPLTNYLAGIVAEEVIKFTGLYKPVSQWVYFNFFNLLNISKINDIIEKRGINEEKEKENIDPMILNIFNEIYKEEIKDINIVIIGFNKVSYEIIKLFIILGLLDNKENKIKIVSENKYQIKEKLDELKHLGKNPNISIIKEKLDCKDNNYIKKDWWLNSNIIIDILPFDTNEKEKISLIKNSQENKKILISLNCSKYSAYSEIFLPENKCNEFIIEETPKPQDEKKEKNEIKLIDDYNDEEDYDKYKNICTLDEALNWSKNYFEDNFIKYIKYLIELISKSHSESDMNKYIDNILSLEKEKEEDFDVSIRLIKIFKKLVTFKLGMNYETIVFYSMEIFEELFSKSTEKLLLKYPSDLLLKNSNKKFWSGARKEPKKIIFDINNEEHFQIIYCMTYFFCEILKLPDIKNNMKNIKQIMEKYEPKKPDSNVKKMKLKEYSYIEKFSLIQFLKSTSQDNLDFQELQLNLGNNNENFEDLEKMNLQLKFIILAANIKLSIFGLNQINISESISKVLRINEIHPSLSSTIAGITVMQLYNLINKKEEEENENKIEENKMNNKDNKDNKKWIKNCVFNLANNTYLFFDINNNNK